MTAQEQTAQHMLRKLSNYRRWCKGAYETGFDRHCLLGAWISVTGHDMPCDIRDLTSVPVLQRIARLISEQFPERACTAADPVHEIIRFNDDEKTTYADVRLILEKAAAAEEEVQE